MFGKRPSVFILLLANLIPLFGVLLFGWNLFSILFLYWLESAIVGFFNILKLSVVRSISPEIDKAFIIPFFIFHYGAFMLVHAIFLFTLFGPYNLPNLSTFIAFLSLFLSHGISYYTNFLGKKEYVKTNISKQMAAPYRRIIIMHFTIILGGVVTMALGSPIGALVILIGLKTALDLFAHIREHTWLAQSE